MGPFWITPYATSSLRSCATYTLTLRRRRSHLASHGYLVSHQMTAHLGAPPAEEFPRATTRLLKKLKRKSARSHKDRPTTSSRKPAPAYLGELAARVASPSLTRSRHVRQ
jgi:hypothetical protein